MTTLPLFPNTYWVVPGRFLAGEYPALETRGETLQRLAGLRAVGINSFVDLTEPDELFSYQHLLPADAKYSRHPIPDCDIPYAVSDMQLIQARIRASLMFGRSVYVHCRAGIGRTGTVVGCYLVEQGLDGKSALKELNVLWRHSARSKSWPTVPQTPEQAEYIVQWPKNRKSRMRAPGS